MTVLWIMIFSFNIHSLTGIPDWLVEPINVPTSIKENKNTVTISNGLISRSFDMSHNSFTTVDYYSYEKQSSLIRAIGPEVSINFTILNCNS